MPAKRSKKSKKPRSPDDVIKKMSRAKLERVVKGITEILYFDCDTMKWDPAKEFDGGTIELVQEQIDNNGLRPPDLEEEDDVEDSEH